MTDQGPNVSPDAANGPKHGPTASPIDVISQYLDALWLERGLSANTLAAYRRDLTGFGGTVDGVWQPEERVLASAYDTPITGWGGRHVNTLRLWKAGERYDPTKLTTQAH